MCSVYCVDSIEIFFVVPMAGNFKILLKHLVEREVNRTSKFFEQSDVLELCMFKSGLALIYPELNIVDLIQTYDFIFIDHAQSTNSFVYKIHVFLKGIKILNLKLLEFTIVCKYCLYSD